jgi:metal-dependent amidase/aminoacylase/carboxypeptidase family protein
LGEDFGLFTQHYPGAMFGLGSGTDSLHNPDYDFPDDIITTEYLFSPQIQFNNNRLNNTAYQKNLFF